MSTEEAYVAGQEACKEGRDIMNIPSYYTETERELFILGYEEAEGNTEQAEDGYDIIDDDDFDLSLDNNNDLDLDFED